MKKKKRMTRVKRNRKKYNNKLRLLIKIIKWFLRNIICFIVGVLYIIYKILQFINNLVAKAFMKLPKLTRVIIIYSLILGCLNGIYESNKQPLAMEESKEEKQMQVVIDLKQSDEDLKELTDFNDEVKEKTNKVCENEIACKIYNNAVSKGLTHEQALIVVSISKHETGNWTSKAFLNKNNFGGVMCRTGLKTYSNFDEGLDGFVNLLKNNYFAKGLNTIEQIGSKYCPIGANNDPTGVNKYWIPNVTKYYNDYLN